MCDDTFCICGTQYVRYSDLVSRSLLDGSIRRYDTVPAWYIKSRRCVCPKSFPDIVSTFRLSGVEVRGFAALRIYRVSGVPPRHDLLPRFLHAAADVPTLAWRIPRCEPTVPCDGAGAGPGAGGVCTQQRRGCTSGLSSPIRTCINNTVAKSLRFNQKRNIVPPYTAAAISKDGMHAL